jgi:hypothetical protein
LAKAVAQKRIDSVTDVPDVGGAALPVEIGTLESKKPPILAATTKGLIPFKVPNHDQWWVGSNGVLLEAPSSWERIGTTWTCKRLIVRPWGMRFVHPLGNGHLLVAITESGVSMQLGGDWQDNAVSLKTKLPLEPAASFPLKRDHPYAVRSVLTAAGDYSMYLDDVLIAKTKVSNPEPLKLNAGFSGTGLPPTLKKGQAAAIIDQSYHLGNSVADGLSFAPGR